jgi:transcription elongation factor/antiterminator RfaH
MDQMNQTDGLTRYFGSLHWFVIHTKPRDEYRVKNHFQGMEIETLLPLYENFQYSHGRMSRVINPLFPNYLFARLDLERHYYKVKWTRGVNRILGAGNEPIPISETVTQMLKDRMGGDGTVKLLEDLQEGDLVQITSGPLKDFIGIFQNRLSSGERVKILVNLIGIEVPVQISRFQIKKAA